MVSLKIENKNKINIYDGQNRFWINKINLQQLESSTNKFE